MAPVYFIIGAAVIFIAFYWWSVRRARKDGATGQLVDSARKHSEKAEQINQMETEVDEKAFKKKPNPAVRGITGIRDFFKRGG